MAYETKQCQIMQKVQLNHKKNSSINSSPEETQTDTLLFSLDAL